MKNGVMCKMKWFVVALLVVLVAGMTIFGIFGFNNTVDYSDSYEINVSIDINIDKAKSTLKNTTEDYFEQKDIKFVSYQMQDDGMSIIYKLTTDETSKIADLESVINTTLDADEDTKGIIAKVSSKANFKVDYMQTGKLLIVFGISIVAIFIYLLIMNKLASALAVVCSSIVSVIAFIALIALTRIPAYPFIDIMAVAVGALTAMLSSSTVAKYTQKIKNLVEKTEVKEIANVVGAEMLKKYFVIFVCILIAGVALLAFIRQYLIIIGLQIIIAGLVATLIAYFVTPLIWTAIKGVKNKRI